MTIPIKTINLNEHKVSNPNITGEFVVRDNSPRINDSRYALSII